MTELSTPNKKSSASRPLLQQFSKISNRTGGIIQAFGNLLFPPHCVSCAREIAAQSRRHREFFCEECLAVFLSPQAVCRRCGSSVPPERAGCDGCAKCRPQKNRFDAVASLGCYEGRLRNAIFSMKHAEGELLALGVGTLLAERLEGDQIYLQKEEKWPDLVIPIPIHWTQRITRGFSGSETIAESVARNLALPTALDLLKWRRKPKRQSTLTPTERIRNVHQAFGVSTSYDLNGAKVLLIDDVMTTGATANEAAKTLKRSGAAVVTVAVAARSTRLI